MHATGKLMPEWFNRIRTGKLRPPGCQRIESSDVSLKGQRLAEGEHVPLATGKRSAGRSRFLVRMRPIAVGSVLVATVSLGLGGVVLAAPAPASGPGNPPQAATTPPLKPPAEPPADPAGSPPPPPHGPVGPETPPPPPGPPGKPHPPGGRPPGLSQLFGPVFTVNGSSSTDACGMAKASGSFTMPGTNLNTVTVAVTGSTLFAGSGQGLGTFADVCVNANVTVFVSGGPTDFTASAVIIDAGPPALPPGSPLGSSTTDRIGKVSSIDGSTTEGDCGQGTSGTFTLIDTTFGPVNVSVTSNTQFIENAMGSGFGFLCVGDAAAVIGTGSSPNLTAAEVEIIGLPHR